MEDTQTAGADESTSAEVPADDVSASPADDAQPEAVAAEGSTPEETTPEADDEPEEWRNFVGKYKGDKAAAGKAFWETQNFASQVRKENEALKAQLAKLASAQEPEPKAEELAPELQVLEKRFNRLQERINGHPKRQQELSNQAITLQGDIREAQTMVKVHADNDFEREKWEQKLRLANLHLSELAQKYQANEDALPDVEWELEKLNRERASIQRQLDSEKARQVQAQQEEQKFQVAFAKEVDDHITSAADKLGIPKDKATRDAMWEWVHPTLTMAFWSAQYSNVPADEIDVPGLVESKVKRFKETLDNGRRADFGQTSQAKLKTAAALGVTPKPANGTTAKPKPIPTAQSEAEEIAMLNKRMEDARRAFVGR